MDKICFICSNSAEVTGLDPLETKLHIDCPLCGTYRIDSPNASYLSNRDRGNKKEPIIRALLSHKVKMANIKGEILHFDAEMINQLLEDPQLPRLMEQADNFIYWAGKTLESASSRIVSHPETIAVAIGSLLSEDAVLIYNYLIEKNLLRGQPHSGIKENLWVALSIPGWERFHELEQSATEIRTAFMAMKFEKPEVEQAYKSFRAMAERLDFDLFPLSEKQEAGIIHNRMRVRIQKSRFMVADLTHQNQGVYWEAGYAEGREIPVFYTCQEEDFDNIHFDAKPSLTIKWSLNPKSKHYLPEAVKELEAAIIHTLKLDPNLLLEQAPVVAV